MLSSPLILIDRLSVRVGFGLTHGRTINNTTVGTRSLGTNLPFRSQNAHAVHVTIEHNELRDASAGRYELSSFSGKEDLPV